MRVGFVTPRYGTEVMGGAETAARLYAEHLVAEVGWTVEAFTTCALDHLTWRNQLEPGDSELNGVTVHRFPSVKGRDPEFFELDAKIRLAPRAATVRQGEEWVELNGPVSPALVDAVCHSGIDVAVFYPYLYYPTVRAITAVPMPAVLHPAAHDEPAIYLSVFRRTFAAADALCYHTAAERALVQRLHPVAEHPQTVLGLGVGEDAATGRAGADVLRIGDRPYLVSVGRVDDHKGSTMLAEYFRVYKERRPGPLALALVGPVSARIAPHPDIVVTGAVGEAEKWDIVHDALVSVSPSALESFSLVVLEAWVQGVPVVVNASCPPTREHCERSGGGLWFGSYREFEAVLDRLLADADLRGELGRRGRAYVQDRYRWPHVVSRYAQFLTDVVARGRAGPAAGSGARPGWLAAGVG